MSEMSSQSADPGGRTAARDRGRDRSTGRPQQIVRTVLTVVSVAVVWGALAMPAGLLQFSPGAFVRLPLAALAVAAIIALLPARPARWVAVLAGLAVGSLLLLKALDIGFLYVLGAPFNPLTDWSQLLAGSAVLRDAVGDGKTVIIVSAVILAVLLAFTALALAARRIANATTSHRSTTRWVIAASTFIWIMCAVTGLHAGNGPIATIGGAPITRAQAHPLKLGPDPWANTPRDQLLTRLHGHDVLLVFVESYGRVAVQQSGAAPGVAPAVDRDLETQTQKLAAAGYHARTGFLTSPTFGGLSWHAHATLQAGVWVNSQTGYQQLITSRRTNLSSAFARAGWRTVGDQPANTAAWPQGMAFYHWKALYDGRDDGYTGPAFGFGRIPDEYTLKNFAHLELQPHHRPVMAEIDLVSSHGPWARVPKLLPWSRVNDDNLYRPMANAGPPADQLWQHPAQGKQAYATSIIYSINSLVTFLQHVHDPNLVVIMLGDHQPAAAVSGQHASRDVPISIVSNDPAVLRPAAKWNWTAGLKPRPDAPVWPMSAFRNRFLNAYSSPRR